ncbi:glycosyltransferase family 2 protein [Actinacidiphila yeochonensis]|uniref:glycosyltransferase family 2 protein n=1 Tax=Actinacidiphila yeochonensis TaxID=89050 RepID=UPI00056B4282|nr:glycosyltransferase family 2 protein [Actinacidiphila yeochonensis]
MPIKVSVVIPVYNPGSYIQDCIDSMIRQSLPDDEYEAIFVDDGSTDDTPARLDAVAAAHSNIHVIHQENSGWPGKPRNVGIAAARGEYVMFVDNDDWLGDEALERMYEYAVANDSELVIGKMAGKGRPVPLELFRKNRPHATVATDPLIDSLTPHKMVSKAFLDRTGLRFPEGRRRLEDHVFISEAYLRAKGISVLSDYVCYYHVKRDDANNAGFQQIDPVGYFGNLREALDVVERYTEPGQVRDKLFRRWLRVEMVGRLSGNRLLRLPEQNRRDLFREIRGVATERFGPGVAGGLAPTQQIINALLVADRYDDVVKLAEWEAGMKPVGTLESLHWEDGALQIGLTAEYQVDGVPLTFTARKEGGIGGERLDLPLTPQGLAAVAEAGADTSARLDSAKVDLVVRERSSASEFFQPITFRRERVEVPGKSGETSRVRAVLCGAASVDPATAKNGKPLTEGIWDVLVRLSLAGWTKEVRLGSLRDSSVESTRVGRLAEGRLVMPYWTDPHGNLSLDVDQATPRLVDCLRRALPERVSLAAGRLNAPLPLEVAEESPCRLRLTANGTGESIEISGTLLPDPEGSRLDVKLPESGLNEAVGWKLEINALPEGSRKRWVVLPFALQPASAGGELRVVAHKAQTPPPAPKPKPLPAPQSRSLLARLGRKVRRSVTR